MQKEDFVKDATFHIYNRTLKPFLLFKDNEDYEWFLDRFRTKIVKYPSSIFAYCLRPNHFHFLIRQDSDKPIYHLFNDVLSPYVRHYNFKYERRGALFEGSLQHIKVEDENYIKHLCHYIHLNPIKANLVESIKSWEYSNLPEWLNKQKDILFNNEILSEYFISVEGYLESIKDYEEYLKDYKFKEYIIEDDF